MRVKTTCTLKTKSIGIVTKGTIFEGTEETLPDFILFELKLNRGILEILPDLVTKKEKKKRVSKPKKDDVKVTLPAKAKVQSQQTKMASVLRKKFAKAEK